MKSGQYFQKDSFSKLKPEYNEANARFFKSIEDVPTKAVTMGIQTIMQSKRIITNCIRLRKGRCNIQDHKG